MLLNEIKNKAQMRRQLKSGDEELLEDIREEIEISIFYKRVLPMNVRWAAQEFVLSHIRELTGTILTSCGGIKFHPNMADYALGFVMRHLAMDALNSEVNLPNSFFDFVVGTRLPSDVCGFVIQTVVDAWKWTKVPSSLELIPEQTLRAFVEEAQSDWMLTRRDADSELWLERRDRGPESLWLVWRHSELQEAVKDFITGRVSEAIEAEPKVWIAQFFADLETQDRELAARMKKARLSSDALISFATGYFTEGHGTETMREAVGMLGYEGSRGEVITEITADDLRALGVDKGGKWMSGAPWRLINLPPNELAYEGTLQRHCVGSQDTGYRYAVEDGHTQIWSLRSQHNAPVLTFEVDAKEWERSQKRRVRQAPKVRGSAIRQLRGKLNRLGGSTRGASADVVYPEQELVDETKVLRLIFERLQVDPASVAEFDPTPPA